jgi:hypothetical protein
MKRCIGCVIIGFLSLVLATAAQTTSSSLASVQVPHLIQFSNVATDEGGNSLSGVVSVRFTLYNVQRGGEPLWTETQRVQLDATGHYSVQLGITKPGGVPTALFTSAQARWLGIQIADQAVQPRVLLMSVPYALKAGDAETIGGLPPSAFVLAAPPNGEMSASTSESASGPSAQPPAGAVTGTGTANFLPLWDSTSDIVSSVLFQSGSGSTAKIGINTIAPASTLDVKGGSTIRGTLSLPATATATAAAGKNSQPLNLGASAFNSGTSTAVKETFQWRAEPVGNNTSSTSGSLNLLFAQGSSTPAETGLNIASNGHITFAPGQTFPGTGTGSVTSVGSGLGLTGGPITTSGTLAINTAVVPQLAANNAFTGNQTISGNIAASGSISGATLSGNGAAISNVNAAQLGGLAPGAYATIGNNSFTGSESIAGTLSVGGNTTIGGKLTAPNGVSLPIAYGFINADGSVSKATSNVASVWDATHNWYAITITGVTYFFSSFVTQVTPTFSTTVPNVTGNTGSVSGNLLVQIYNSAGTPIQAPFQFVTFAP